MKKSIKIALYFLAHGKLTDAAQADAERIETAHAVNIKFRNGNAGGNGAPEKADYVAGDPIPLEYLKYPIVYGDGRVTGTPDDAESVAEVPQEAKTPSSLAAEVGSFNGGASSGGWS